jgi:hypothetical protein
MYLIVPSKPDIGKKNELLNKEKTHHGFENEGCEIDFLTKENSS